MNQCPHADSWGLYRMLTQSHPDLGDRAAIDMVTPSNLGAVVQAIAGGQQYVDATETVPSRSIPEEVRQGVRRLVDSAVVLDGA